MDKRVFLATTALTAASAGMMAAPFHAMAADAVRAAPFGPAPALAIGVGPADIVSGYVEAHIGFGQWRKFEDGDETDSASFTQVGGAGRLNWWLSPGLSLQVDAYGNAFSKDFSSMGIAGHLAWRSVQGAIGVMAATGQAGSTDRLNALALEGQLYLGNITLYAQLGTVNNFFPGSESVNYAALQGRFFLNPNTVLKGDVAFADSLYGDGLFRLGVEIEHRPIGLPVSFFARGQVDSLDTPDNCCGDRQTATEFKLGARLFVNAPTLLDNDRRGATFLDLNPVFGDKASKIW